MKSKRIATAVACVVTLIVFITSCASRNWIKGKPKIPLSYQASSHSGLWRYCNDIDGHIECRDVADGNFFDADKIKVVRAFLIMAVLSTSSAGVFIAVGFFKDKVMPVCTILLLFTLIFGIIAMAVYTEEIEKERGNKNSIFYHYKVSYGWSYALGWLANGIAIIAAVVSFTSHFTK